MLESIRRWWWKEWDAFWLMLGGQGFVATMTAVFVMGLLLGWAVFTHEIERKPISLGSAADWIAAIGAVVAALSTVAIATLGQRAISNKDRIARELAVATIASAVIADMEVAVRVSRHWQVLTSDRMIKLCRDLYLHQIPKDDSSVSGLPSEILANFMAARSTLPAMLKAARNLEDVDSEHRRKYLALQFERFGSRLKSSAEYVAGDRLDIPWQDWEPQIDKSQFNKNIMKLFHSMEAKKEST